MIYIYLSLLIQEATLHIFTDIGNSSAKLFKLFKLISYFQEIFEPEF